MKRLALLLMFAPLCVYAQTGVVQGHCYLGGKQATTSGMNSSNYLDGNIPACTVTVYLTGTLTKQTITKPDGSSLANPFTANTASAVDPGGWIFRAATNQGLDVVLSGGNSNPSCITAPLCYTQPVTLTDVFPTQSFSPVSGLASATATYPVLVNNGPGPVTSGNVNISCANGNCGEGVQMSLTPPSSGQWVYIFPTSVSQTASGAMYTANVGPTSAQLGNNAFCSLGSGTATVTWSGFGTSLAALGISPSNVTAVYPFAYSTNSYGPGGGQVCGPIGAITYTPNINPVSVIGSGSGGVGTVTINPSPNNAPWAIQNVQGSLSGVTGSNFSTIQIQASSHVGGDEIGPSQSSVSLVGLWVQYTGTVVNQPSTINIAPPLNYVNGTLGLNAPIDTGTDTGTADNYAVSIPWLSPSPATTVTFIPANDNLTTTPKLNLNSVGALPILGPQGAALQAHDLKAGRPATIKYGTTNDLYLQNPQVSGSGGGTTTNALTMNNSGSGAASGTTFNGSAAQTISYNTIGAQQALTLTTTGSSGPATLSGGALNIPQYSGGGGGTPGGSNTQLQYNNSGAFGGMSGVTYPGTAGMLNAAASDTYTGATTYGYVTSLLNGVDPSVEYKANQVGDSVSAFIAGEAIPSGGTNHQAQAIAGYITNSSTSVNAVGAYFWARCLATGTSCWGSNPGVSSASGHPAIMIGEEVDANINNTGDTIRGIFINGAWTAQPSTSYAVDVTRTGGSTGKWDAAFRSEDGKAGIGLDIWGDEGGSGNSQQIVLRSGSPTSHSSVIQANSAGDINLSPSSNTVNVPNLNISGTCTGCSSSTGLSGMTAGQVPIAATATTVTSSKALLGTDTSIATATGTFTASNIAGGDANGGVTPITALPNGITATTQTAASNDTKVATDAYVDGHFIASGTAAMGTGAISSGTCATVVTVGATGVATTDVIVYTPNTDPTVVTGYAVSATGSLYIWAYPTANNVNFKVCNNTSGSITPSALTLNWKVTR